MPLTISDINIEIIRKNIKNIHLRVTTPNGEVVVSAPKRVSERIIADFVSSKLDWIRAQQAKMREIGRPERREYALGESMYLWGVKYSIVVSYGRRTAIEIIGDEIIITFIEGYTREQRIKYVNSFYRKQLTEEATLLLDKWQSITGLNAESLNIRNMKTKWGTCNVRSRRILLNLQLAKKPIICLQYVIVHELMHLIEKSHGAAFKALMDKYFKNWKAVKKDLNNRILDYYED